jgi:hypothetical protein
VDLRLVPPPLSLFGGDRGGGGGPRGPPPRRGPPPGGRPGGPLGAAASGGGAAGPHLRLSPDGEAEVRAVAEGPWGRSEAKARLAPADRARALVLGTPPSPGTWRPRAFWWRRPSGFPWRRTWWPWTWGSWTCPRGPGGPQGYLRRGAASSSPHPQRPLLWRLGPGPARGPAPEALGAEGGGLSPGAGCLGEHGGGEAGHGGGGGFGARQERRPGGLPGGGPSLAPVPGSSSPLGP